MCTLNLINLQGFDESRIHAVPNKSLFASCHSFCPTRTSSDVCVLRAEGLSHCVMFVFICGRSMFGPPSSPAAVPRTRSVSESESTFGLPSSFSAPTFLKSFYQGSLGSLSSLADSGSLKRWEGGTQSTPLTLTQTHQPGTWQRGFHGWDWATEMHSLTLGGAVGCQTFLTPSFIVLVLRLVLSVPLFDA